MQPSYIFKKAIIDSQLFVALTGSLFASFFMLEEGTFKWPTFFLIFITYFSGYLYTKYQNTKLLHRILILNAIAGIVCMVLILQNHNVERLYKWVIICGLGLLYNSKFLSQSIRQVPLIKVFYVGFIWALVNAWLSFQTFNVPIFFISLLYITALVLPFDIRDQNQDDVITFPKIIGSNGTKTLDTCMILLACFLSINFLQYQFALAFCISAAFAILLSVLASVKRNDLFFSFGVELCSGLPLLIWLLFQI